MMKPITTGLGGWRKFLSFIGLFCLLLLAFSLNVQSQQIKRKGSLGVNYFPNPPDSLLRKLNISEGAIVQNPLPNTTADKIGVKPLDVIVRINATRIANPAQLAAAARLLREGEPITVGLVRNGQSLELKGTVIGKPKETSETADVIYGEFAYRNGYVRTIYKTLKGKKPIGTIYFLQGLPCYSMDNFTKQDMTRQALDAMVDRGFAVYRMEKADMGDNVNMPPCETMGYNEELAMYKAGYENLLKLPNVDTSKIFLFGHSMGGITAPLLAEIFQPKGVAVYGTVFKPWMDYLFDAFLLQQQLYGADLAGLRAELEEIKPYAYDYFYNKKSFEEVCQSQEGLKAMSELMGYDPRTQMAAGRNPLCHKELNQQPLTRAWKNTNGFVLAIYGECDIAAIHPDDHIDLINYVNSQHPGKGTFWLAPRTTHTFEDIGTMKEFINWQSNPTGFNQYAATRFNPKVFDYVCNWMKEVLDK